MPSAATVINGHGDDLDDGLDLDSGLLARSDAEDEELDLEAGDADAQDDDDEEGHTQIVEGLDDDEDDVPPVQKVTDVKAKKRKAADESPREQSRAVKKSRQEPNPAPLSASELWEFFNDSLKRTYSKASEMELNDLRLPSSAVLSTSAFTDSRDLANLPAFIQTQLPSLPKNIKKPGTPSIVILSLSGIRCADVVRSLKGMQPKPPGEIAKLFAKHFKVPEQVEYLKKTKVVIAVGTPGRIGKLIQEDALHIRQQTIILLDASFRDSKQRTVLTIPEIRDELWRTFLGDKEIRNKVLAPGVKFAVY